MPKADPIELAARFAALYQAARGRLNTFSQSAMSPSG
jgi:hypothetical protein